jgi:hypothetical protein
MPPWKGTPPPPGRYAPGPPPPPHAPPPPHRAYGGSEWGFPAPSIDSLTSALGDYDLAYQASLVLHHAPDEIVLLAWLLLGEGAPTNGREAVAQEPAAEASRHEAGDAEAER